MRVLTSSLILLVSQILLSGSGAGEVRYNRDVLPILADKCFACHGADKATRKAGLRLDDKLVAFAERDGIRAIVPRNPGKSALISRIFSTDPEKRMPPPEEGLPLTERETSILKEWIEQGANYETHWAFRAPEKPLVPPDRSKWGHNEIDRFIIARLEQENLSPQRPASREEWIRRVTLDLTGLPPTLEEVEAFLSHESGMAFAEVVDRLLASPRFGERMASWWLDGARYGDSHGYDNDLHNNQWPWRDWIINAFNANKSFDAFTVEQLAGDLLPEATDEQILATAFNRNHRIQTEDGAIDEEWRTEYVIDRVQTMGSVWMGLTLNCSRCHDHKYDPVSQKEFYQLFAFFNNLDEKGFINNLRGSAEPRIRYRAQEFEKATAELNGRTNDQKARERELAQLEARFPTVMVMKEMTTPRKAFVLGRGQYDSPGEEVAPGLPQILPALPKGAEMNRLGLARWLVNGQHPLTARVLVNRIWEQLFGTGIVKSTENLGVQAAWPSHPRLLDWLAVDFVESDWDMKALIKKMVLSSTYRQSHAVDAIRLEKDPGNRLLSRGPRIRLSAEMVRDQALAISGLLHEQIGGPSVKPYQPEGLWEEVEKRGTFQRDSGDSLYRRSLYTTIRRTVAPPGMVLFDMPSREICMVSRSRTNTPLQALALMNEVTYVEAARKFAERMMANGTTAREQIAWAFRSATSRRASEEELEVLLKGYQRRLSRFQATPEHAEALLSEGESPVLETPARAELAALATVASIILNLDELINK